ncbi:MAG: DUF3109 family protein [Chitinophagaceae bacterium]
MIAIENTLISDELILEQFLCDLQACKGGCCVEGDCGAPLEPGEPVILEEIFDQVRPFLTPAGVREIEIQGKYVQHPEHGQVTPTIDHQMCAYGVEENGIVHCGIEKAFLQGVIPFKKPLSCHLYPVRIQHQENYDALNYEPRESLCQPACRLGKHLRMPVYRFLKDALSRKYGEEFYRVLDQVAREKFGVIP